MATDPLLQGAQSFTLAAITVIHPPSKFQITGIHLDFQNGLKLTNFRYAPIEKWSWSEETVHFESSTSVNRMEDYMQYPEIFPLDPPYTCDPITGVPIPK